MVDPDRIKQYMESDFSPGENLKVEYRVANALEYIAYHMGQINKKLDGISEAIKPST
jgi:hypothetical protein